MKNKRAHKFFRKESKVVAVKHDITLSRGDWQLLLDTLLPHLDIKTTLSNEFENVHLCWVYCLVDIFQKIEKKYQKTKQAFSIKLTPAEFYALKDIIDNDRAKDPKYIPMFISIKDQITKALLD
ncbi:hypothetical protein [Winogradskyella sp.]|uniref:hypothetical protein n=1 Tax=Winogradskyella sp. TaxID=1883156 RepID=UPI0026343F7A|nr:hypothetical protein [Winogradskyella sp.]